MNKHIKCIICPIGCSILVDFDKETKEIISFSGNDCKRGIKFIEEEVVRPSRLLTTTIEINSKICCRLPVRSNVLIPKEKMQEMVREVKKIRINIPVKMGQIIKEDFMDSGIKILSCATFNS